MQDIYLQSSKQCWTIFFPEANDQWKAQTVDTNLEFQSIRSGERGKELIVCSAKVSPSYFASV
jgi:hypothetical protein